MFYSIDLDKLRVLHKTPQMSTCGLLATLEASDCAVMITSFATPGSLSGFTVFELHKLYANLCGSKFVGFDEAKLRRDIYALMDSLPVTDCNHDEVVRQCAAVSDDSKAYRYVKGAIKPALRNDDLTSLIASNPTADFQYTVDPPIISESSKVTESRIPIRSGGSSGVTIVRPTEGLGAEIWTVLDENPHLCDGLAIQAEAKQRGWNTLTAIMQLAQWKKFNNK